ncbi:hypothetical protein KM043_014286 [Ampulex compressa]|nr:hypothetical protein KM043_014286 [Ampulex compressa]
MADGPSAEVPVLSSSTKSIRQVVKWPTIFPALMEDTLDYTWESARGRSRVKGKRLTASADVLRALARRVRWLALDILVTFVPRERFGKQEFVPKWHGVSNN